MKDLIVVIICLFFLVSCAGGNSQYQRNMGLNALGYGLGGAAVGAIGASVFHGDPAKGAFVGALTGALLGAGNTPAPEGYYNQPAVGYNAPRATRCMTTVPAGYEDPYTGRMITQGYREVEVACR